MERVHAAWVVLAAGTMSTIRLLFNSQENVCGLRAMPVLGRTFGANGDLVGTLRGKGDPVSSFNTSPSMETFSVQGYDGRSMGLGGFPGLDSPPLPGFVKKRLGRTYLMYGMGADSGSGRVRRRKRRLRVEYDQTREPVYEEARSAFKVLSEETGRKTRAIGRPLTSHPWGAPASDRIRTAA